MSKDDQRFILLQAWLSKLTQDPEVALTVASTDASFRRYFRLHAPHKTFIVMDAPPEKEPIHSYLQCAQILEQKQVHVPKILAADKIQGFILMQDFGSTHYQDQLENDTDTLYQAAMETLLLIQDDALDGGEIELPEYDEKLLQTELNLFENWYLNRHLGHEFSEDEKTIWEDTKHFLIEACKNQPQVCVHRDYHSRNLMVTPEGKTGVIDFQGMVMGPISYDLASLFKDCYIEWPREQQLAWCDEFRIKSSHLKDVTREEFIRWYDLTGLQRHLKILGIFCRLNYRDGKPIYLEHLGVAQRYIAETLHLYPELSAFQKLFTKLPHTHADASII